MIIIDYSGIAVAAVFSQDCPEVIEEQLIRHMILNVIRRNNFKYREKFGKTVIACDNGSWRKGVYAQYKAHRGKHRDESPLDWASFFELIHKIKVELKENFAYPVLEVKNAEADDIIGQLVRNTQEFGQHEENIIISGDKDFLQLQRYGNVKQFSPQRKSLISEEDPTAYLFEHIIRGCGGDGVPNILSPDNAFTDGIRQSPIRKTKVADWYSNRDNLATYMTADQFRNFKRNERMIDLSFTPQEICDEVDKQQAEQNNKPNSKILNYLIKNRCAMLAGSVEEFFTKA